MGAPSISPDEYATIKQLLGKGYTGIKVAAIVGRSRCLVSRVNRSWSYHEYLSIGRARAKKSYDKYKKEVASKQLPLDKPKKTKVDMKEDLTIKLNALIETVVTYKRYAALSSDKYSQWRWNNAIEHLEEARLWLKEAF